MGGLFHKFRHPRRCYMVCATARSGSNLLTDGLHATRKAGRPKQFFLEKFEEEYGRHHGLDPNADYAGYTRGIVKASATSNEVFGFKVMGWYLEDFLGRMRRVAGKTNGELEVLQQIFPRLSFLHIIRRNKLRQAISKAKAIQSGLWKIQPGNAASGEPAYDRSLVARCLRDTLRDEAVWTSFFSRNAIRPCLVHYEDLCSNYDATLRAVLAFLRIKVPAQSQIEPITIRQADTLSLKWEKLFLSEEKVFSENQA